MCIHVYSPGFISEFRSRGGKHIEADFKGGGGAKAPPEINPAVQPVYCMVGNFGGTFREKSFHISTSAQFEGAALCQLTDCLM
jgi:hypothetical protein